MQEAGPSILAWAIEGAVNFARNGYQLQTPDVVEEVTEAYRGQEDWVGNFVAECCTTAADARTGAAELYQAYRAWAERSGEDVYKRQLFESLHQMRARRHLERIK